MIYARDQCQPRGLPSVETDDFAKDFANTNEDAPQR